MKFKSTLLSERSQTEKNTLYDFIDTKFWKRQNYGKINKDHQQPEARGYIDFKRVREIFLGVIKMFNIMIVNVQYHDCGGGYMAI